MNEVPESLSQNTHDKLKLNLMSITGQNFGAAIGRSLQLGSKIGCSSDIFLELTSSDIL